MTALRTQWQQTNRKSFGIALFVAGILGFNSYNAYYALATKADMQQASLSQLKRWKAEYEVLVPYQSQWNNTLISAHDITDQYHVYNALNLSKYGLRTNEENLTVATAEQITQNGTPIRASRVCLKTGGDRGFTATAPHFSPDLLEGLEKLAERRDVEIQNIQLGTENGIPKALLDLCLIFRK